uniref:Cadherin domain-containing protein n=1 Tax=Timema genevievae TaxID=629358 RepID=A0A7R9PMW0_TIMGE|nr:unnamed protein product [Timema genevievae]
MVSASLTEDRGSPPRNSSTSIRVSVLDNDDLSPKFARDVYRTSVTEFYPVTGARVHQELRFDTPLLAFDQDLAIATPVRYDLIAGNDRHLFSIDPRNGSIFLEQELDLDQERTLPGNTFVLQGNTFLRAAGERTLGEHLRAAGERTLGEHLRAAGERTLGEHLRAAGYDKVQASQVDNPLKTGVARVEVELLDLNDNLPQFEVQLYNISIVENLPNGFSVLQVSAADKDQGDNGEFSYQLEDPSEAFTMDPRSGWLTVRDQAKLDRESQSSLFMKVFAREKAPSVVRNVSASSVSVEVTLLDANDNNPSFLPSNLYEFTVESDAKVGSVVGRVQAVDPDLGRNGMVLYDLQRPAAHNGSTGAGLPFAVDAQSGNLLVIDSPLAEGRHAVFVEASDQPSNPSERRFSLAVVTVEVVGTNSRDPQGLVAILKGLSRSSRDCRDPQGFFEILKGLLRSSRACRDPQGIVAILKGLSRSSRACRDPQGLVAILKGLLRSSRACRDPQGLVEILRYCRDPQVIVEILKGLSRSSRAYCDPQGLVEILKGLLRSSRDCRDPKGFAVILKSLPSRFESPSKGSEVPDFLGSPYEFWVGDNVPVGTSVGQMRVTDAVDRNKVIYDMLHSYHDGVVSSEHRPKIRTPISPSSANQTERARHLVHPPTDVESCLESTRESLLPTVPFAVEERSGTITVVDDISKFEPVLYDFEAVATDGSDVTLVTNVTIHVVELDRMGGSERDKVAAAPIQFRVRENLSGALVGQLLNHTAPGGRNSSAESGRWRNLRFTIANQQDVADKFAVSQDGTLYTQRGLDREEREDYRLTLIAENSRGVVRGAGVYQVNVLVEDENDNPPVFDRSSYEGRIQENSPSGSEVKLDHPIKASDADLGGNAQFTFTLHGDGSELFSVEQPTGRVYLRAGTLDREEKPIYLLRVVARDKGNLNSEVKLTIYVDDVNDNAPTFLQMVSLLDQDVEISGPQGASSDPNSTLAPHVVTTNFTDRDDALYAAPLVTVSENTPVGMPILRLLAGDRDAGSNATVTYGIPLETYVTNKILLPPKASSKNHFSIHPMTGEVSVARVLPPETEFLLNVTAVDGGGATGNVSIRIYVRDVNDHAPVFKKSWYTFNLKEGYYVSHPIGAVEATDQDHGDNANVSYVIVQSGISEGNGTLSVTGNVDRETRDSYSFQVMAQDGGPIKDRKRSVVDVEVNVLDVNDNAPSFYNYDHILQIFSRSEEGAHASENPLLVPIYYASVLENSPPGTVVSKVSANDSDFPGNGNGLLLFNIPYGSDGGDVFAVDSKEGIIRTVGKLDFETQASYNVSVVASDLGNPSLSSTAVLSVSVVDVHEEEEEGSGEIRRPMFAHRYYEVEVEENSAPMTPLLDLNVTETYRKLNLKFSLVPTPGSDSFRIQPRNGTLYVVKSLDRETTDKYELRVRVDNVKKGRGMPVLLYPLPAHRLADLVYLKEVTGKIKEHNMAVTTKRRTQFTRYTAATGQRVTGCLLTPVFVQAVDADEGLNADVRYQILGRADDESRKFTVDPLTGQVRSIVSFSRDAGRVFGFDVKATDKRGADDGRSSITNVFLCEDIGKKTVPSTESVTTDDTYNM